MNSYQQRFHLLLPLLLLLLLGGQQRLLVLADLQCRDANGAPLDWFAVLKQPGCLEYAYVSSAAPDAWTQPSEANLNKSGPVFATLSQIFSRAAAEADILAAYNDERPEEAMETAPAWSSSTTTGHMKGVVTLNAGQRGFWLIHSVPKFPDLSQPSLIYPNTGVMYGQSFLCLTVNSSAMADLIGGQLFVSHPDLYQINVSATAQAQWPNWADLKRRKPPPAKLYNSSAHLLTSGGLPVLHVAKSAHLKKDLYAGLLAGQLDSSIQVESWQHGSKLLNSTCNVRYNVTKVTRVRIGGNLSEFRSTSDHSKWCVATTGPAPYACVGDMNRAESQFRRGGGIACLALPGLHRLFSEAVVKDQPCGGGPDPDDHPDAGELLTLLSWMMIAVFSAIGCTVILVVLLLRFALTRRRGRPYQAI